MSSIGGLVPPTARAVRRHRFDLQFLPAVLEVTDTPASPGARYTAATLVAFFIVAVGWAIVGHVDIIATAPGTVIPVGKTKIVQPLEAGVVKAILVADGDHVHAGQRLIELDVVAAAAERDRLALNLQANSLVVAGLLALRQDLLAGAGLSGFVAPPAATARDVRDEQAAIAARRDEQLGKVASLVQQVAAKQSAAAENQALVDKIDATLPILQQKRDLYRSLLHVQFTNKLAWLDSEQAYSEAVHELVVQRQHASEILADKSALMRQLAQTRASYVRDILKDFTDAQGKESDLEQQVAAASHKADQTVLAAPIDGTVQQLSVHTVGGVVTPAEQLVRIVPDSGPMLIEATVSNRDVGFVHIGQAVEVKVAAFQFTRYGLLHGHIVDVNRDVTSDDRQTPSRDGEDDQDIKNSDNLDRASGYATIIALDQTVMNVDGQKRDLEPGMVVTAEIATGKRSISSYLLSPLSRYVNESGKER